MVDVDGGGLFLGFTLNSSRGNSTGGNMSALNILIYLVHDKMFFQGIISVLLVPLSCTDHAPLYIHADGLVLCQYDPQKKKPKIVAIPYL